VHGVGVRQGVEGRLVAVPDLADHGGGRRDARMLPLIGEVAERVQHGSNVWCFIAAGGPSPRLGLQCGLDVRQVMLPFDMELEHVSPEVHLLQRGEPDPAHQERQCECSAVRKHETDSNRAR
jgi:hypothetical protein